MTFSIITNTRGSFAMVSLLEGPLLVAVFAFSRERGDWCCTQSTWIGNPPSTQERERLTQAARFAIDDRRRHRSAPAA